MGTHVALHLTAWFLYQAALPACGLLLAGIAAGSVYRGFLAGPVLTAWGWASSFVERWAVSAQWALFIRAHPQDLSAVTMIGRRQIAWTPFEAAAAGAATGIVTALLAETRPRAASRDPG
jgi:hypothetical protein